MLLHMIAIFWPQYIYIYKRHLVSRIFKRLSLKLSFMLVTRWHKSSSEEKKIFRQWTKQKTLGLLHFTFDCKCRPEAPC